MADWPPAPAAPRRQPPSLGLEYALETHSRPKSGKRRAKIQRGVTFRASKIPSPAVRTGTGLDDNSHWIMSLSFNVWPSESGRNAGLAMNVAPAGSDSPSRHYPACAATDFLRGPFLHSSHSCIQPHLFIFTNIVYIKYHGLVATQIRLHGYSWATRCPLL